MRFGMGFALLLAAVSLIYGCCQNNLLLLIVWASSGKS